MREVAKINDSIAGIDHARKSRLKLEGFSPRSVLATLDGMQYSEVLNSD